MLTDLHCQPIHPGEKPPASSEVERWLHEIPQWNKHEKTLDREYRFAGFPQAMAFVNRAAKVAIEEDHHPDIGIAYDRVRLVLTTHQAGGLTRNDFILAAKMDQAYEARA